MWALLYRGDNALQFHCHDGFIHERALLQDRDGINLAGHRVLVEAFGWYQGQSSATHRAGLLRHCVSEASLSAVLIPVQV